MRSVSRISCRTWAVAILVLFAAAGAAVVDDYGVSVDTHNSIGGSPRRTWSTPWATTTHCPPTPAIFPLPSTGTTAWRSRRRCSSPSGGARPRRQPYGASVPPRRHPPVLAVRRLRLLPARPPAVRQRAARPPGDAAVPAPPPPVRPRVLQQQGRPLPVDVHDCAVHLIHRTFEKDTVRAFAVLGSGSGGADEPAHHGHDALRRRAGHAGVGPAPCCAAEWAPARSEDDRGVRGGVGRDAVRDQSVPVERPASSSPRRSGSSPNIRTILPGNFFQGTTGSCGRSAVALRSDVGRHHDAAVHAAAGRRRGRRRCVARRRASRPGAAQHAAAARNAWLAACLTAPLLAVAALGAHTFNGWRHLYFLHAPLRAAGGVRAAPAGVARRGLGAPRDVCGVGRRGGGHPARHGAHPSASERLLQFPRRQRRRRSIFGRSTTMDYWGYGGARRVASSGADLLLPVDRLVRDRRGEESA